MQQFVHNDANLQINAADLQRLADIKAGRLGKAVEALHRLRPIVRADQQNLCDQVWALWSSSGDAMLMAPRHTVCDNGDPNSPQSQQSTKKRAASKSPPFSPSKTEGIHARVSDDPMLTVGPGALDRVINDGLKIESEVKKTTVNNNTTTTNKTTTKNAETTSESTTDVRTSETTSSVNMHIHAAGLMQHKLVFMERVLGKNDAVVRDLRQSAAALIKQEHPAPGTGMPFVTCCVCGMCVRALKPHAHTHMGGAASMLCAQPRVGHCERKSKGKGRTAVMTEQSQDTRARLEVGSEATRTYAHGWVLGACCV